MSQWRSVWPRQCKNHHSVPGPATSLLQLWTRQRQCHKSPFWGYITCGQWCSCLVTLSRGCLTITAAFSGRLDAYVCTIETNPATCGRSTVSHLRFKRTTVMSSFPAFEMFARKWVKWLSSQMNLSKLAVWKMAFWPLVVHDAEFNRRNERGDGANWWFIDAMITQPASISLPLTIPSQY